jgi:hypothetical protein
LQEGHFILSLFGFVFVFMHFIPMQVTLHKFNLLLDSDNILQSTKQWQKITNITFSLTTKLEKAFAS